MRCDRLRAGADQGARVTLADAFRHADGTLDDDPWPLVRELAAGGDRSSAAPVRAAMERYAAERNWYGRDLMAHILAGLSGADAFPLLLRLYAGALRGDDDDDGETLGHAVSSAMRSDPAGCRATILPLLAGGDPDLRQAAFWALGHVYEPSDMDTLRDALKDPDPVIRRAALSSLPGVSGDPQAYDLVVTALRDRDDWVRSNAVLLLAWSAPPEVIDHLLPMVADPVTHVRSPLGEAIGRRAANSDRAPVASAALRELLSDPEPSVRAGAVRGLGMLGLPLDALRPMTDDPDWWVRAAVADVLAVHVRQWPPARPLLEHLAGDADPTVRWTAQQALDRPE